MFDVEHIRLTDPDDPKIREITTRMSRFACNLETEEERYNEKAYIIETDVPIVLKCYAPDKVTSEKNVYLTPKEQRSGSRIFITPGVIALVMFVKTEPMKEYELQFATTIFLHYLKKIKGSYREGNDLLINGKKILGLAVHHNQTNGMNNIKFMLTYNSEHIKPLLQGDDFIDRKYLDITGVCDETDMGVEEVREIVRGFIDEVLSWRSENDS